MISTRFLDKVDLYLLILFLVLYHKRSVSRIMTLLDVERDEVSDALKNLRARTGYPLFVRFGRKIRPTFQATMIINEINSFLEFEIVEPQEETG